MIKGTLGILAASTLFVLGCGDTPTQPPFPTPFATASPTRTPTPTPSSAPVVASAEATLKYYPGLGGWIIRGSHLFPDPIATFESGGSVIELWLEETTFSGGFVGVVVPIGTAPGMYTPCVETIYGKGCGSFLVTVE